METNMKHALVVGGSGGIGLTVVRKLIQQGYFVSATYLTRKPEDIQFCQWYKTDVLEIQSVLDNIRQAVKNNGNFDVVIYGPTCELSLLPIFKLNWESFEKNINIQVRGFFYTIKELLPILKTNPVKIIVILTEMCYLAPSPRMADYVFAKYGLMGFARALSAELVETGSAVCTVSPGLIDTELIKNFPSKFLEIEAEKNANGQITPPDSVAYKILDILDKDSSELNGKNYFINESKKHTA